MTTIACDLRMIASDSCMTVTDDGIGSGQFQTRKLHRIGSSIFAERGESMAGVWAMLRWIKDGAKWGARPLMPNNADFYLLELSPDGIFLWDSDYSRDPIDEPNFAIGSGAKVALYAMRVLKMTPHQAVREAAKVDAYTKAPFYVEHLRRRK